MTENEKKYRDAEEEKKDTVFEGGTGGDKKTHTEDVRKAGENKQAYEGLRSMIINPDDDEEEKKDKAGE
ncbi:MAG: hypothetical protein INR69_00590 [Mucilaginibacter polytrichastri]|nr:hypothetical protein [Mucilaginibacter polytrichastri]